MADSFPLSIPIVDQNGDPAPACEPISATVAVVGTLIVKDGKAEFVLDKYDYTAIISTLGEKRSLCIISRPKPEPAT